MPSVSIPLLVPNGLHLAVPHVRACPGPPAQPCSVVLFSVSHPSSNVPVPFSQCSETWCKGVLGVLPPKVRSFHFNRDLLPCIIESIALKVRILDKVTCEEADMFAGKVVFPGLPNETA